MTPEQIASYITAFWLWSIITVFIKNWLDNKKMKNQRLYEFEKEFFYKKQEAFITIDNYMAQLRKYILEMDNKINYDIEKFLFASPLEY